MGVVYYANYFVWFEVARADLLRSLGWTYREMEHAGVSLPVIEAHCEYRKPARYDDEIEVRTKGRMLSPVRMVTACIGTATTSFTVFVSISAVQLNAGLKVTS